MVKFHRIKEAKIMDNHTLIIEFLDGEKVRYDIKPLLEKFDMFGPLKEKEFLYECKVDKKGYGLYWNDDIDISCNELWENGERIA